MKQILVLVSFLLGAAHAADAPVVTPLLLKELADIPGKEALVITVTFQPGGADPVHQHPGHAFVYVLEGSIVMQMKGDEPVTLHAGQVFYEKPGHVHAVGRNASATKPAKFLVVMIKDKGAEAVLPAD
jgi:quercetin dioxygenase-like cupin family protein